tara:strand:- start:2722 stop:3618 length:897 start_codon:yes stop_codon:yes gene_type:complete
MNFQQLKYIVALEEFKNFSRAAEACDVAQSTLSKEIQRIEHEYKVIIFDRTRNPVVPTLKGKDLIEKAKELLLIQKEFIQIAEQKKNEVTGKLNLAISEIIAPYLVPLLVSKIAKKYPKLDLYIKELSDWKIEDLLNSEEIDAAVMISPSLSHSYFEQTIYNEEIKLYTKEDNFIKSNKVVNLSELTTRKLYIHSGLKNIFNRQFEVNSSNNKITDTRINYLNGNLETLRNIINQNGGTMLIPNISRSVINYDHKKFLIDINPKPKFNVVLISSRGFAKNRILKHLFKDLKAITKERN